MNDCKNARKPEWLRTTINSAGYSEEVEKMLKELKLFTVCEEANCPNRGECFSKKRATFMILGNICTRNCTFCNVNKGIPLEPDEDEPEKIALAVKQMQIRHAVITSVTRDDLPDGGSGHFVKVINEIKKLHNQVIIEVLIPDFKGDAEALKNIAGAAPQIINHNLETVPALYPTVRPMAVYNRSLELLKKVKTFNSNIHTKSGIMLGLGEKKEQVLELLRNLKAADCDFITIGQYLRPTAKHHEVVEYVHPDVFDDYGNTARAMGFKYVASAPLIRSSYNAEDAMHVLNTGEESKKGY